jgi:hypothetical protein
MLPLNFGVLWSKKTSVEAPWEARKKIVDASFDKDHGVDTGGTTQLAGLLLMGPTAVSVLPI